MCSLSECVCRRPPEAAPPPAGLGHGRRRRADARGRGEGRRADARGGGGEGDRAAAAEAAEAAKRGRAARQRVGAGRLASRRYHVAQGTERLAYVAYMLCAKFWCDLQWVEQYWNDAKRKTRELCDYTITGLKRQFPLSLASVPISNQRNYMQRSLDIMRALREIGRDGDFAKIPALKKQYKSHRQTSGLAPQAAPRAGRTVTRARRITYARDAANNPAAAARAAD